MREFSAGQFDIAVIGAGHAGIEAALAGARLGLKTVCFTINLDAVGNMPCNPAIGGTGKGHLVRDLDALGGEMARAADEACIQYRMLNRGKGPAVHSLRAQADRRLYQQVMKRTLERQENLTLRQGEAVDIRLTDGRVSQVVLSTGAVYDIKAVILATGTFLRGRTIVGECVEDSGPDGMHASLVLSDRLRALGLPLRRFKTGTPPRVNARTVDFSKMELQRGDDDPLPFSFSTDRVPENRAVCYLTYTNEETHRIIRENLDRSPIYAGEHGFTVFLKISPESAVSRLQQSKVKRPVVMNRTPEELAEFIPQNYAARMPYYEQAQLTFKGEDCDIEALIASIPTM